MLQRKKTQQMKEEEEDDDGEGIEDDYDGINLKNKGKGADNEFAEAPKILGDDFMNELKLADVPDSDDECYF